MPRAVLTAAAALLAIVAGACGSAPQETAPTSAESRSAPSARPAPSRPARPVRRTERRPARRTETVAAVLEARLPPGAGAAVAPLAGGPVTAVGEMAPTPAWSTMKVPVIVATLLARRAGALPGGREPTELERDAIWRSITASDNEAVQTLYDELVAVYGGDRQATGRIEATLRLAGDASTHVNAQFTRPPFSNFGQTRWALREMAVFYRALAAGNLLPPRDRELILDAMGAVDRNQRWGAWAVRWPTAAIVKGGWGPRTDGGYDVLQAAIIPGPEGFVVTWATVARSFAEGGATLSELAHAAARALRRR